MNCAFTGCGLPRHAHGLCQGHHVQRKAGKALRPLKKLHFDPDPKTRISDRYTINPETGCHEWTGLRNAANYGRVLWLGKPYIAHRLSYIAFIGPIPSDGIICHRCDNPACVNPEHLFLGTHKTNAEDKVAKHRHPAQKRTHCANGHLRTDKNTAKYFYGGKRVRVCKDCSRTRSSERTKKFNAIGLTSRGKKPKQWVYPKHRIKNITLP